MTRRIRRAALALSAAAVLAAASAGCRQKMAQQPYYRPLEPTEFFEDGRSARHLVEGVVARGQLMFDDDLGTGLTREAMLAGVNPLPPKDYDSNGLPTPEPGAPSSIDNYKKTFPFEVTARHLERGKMYYTTLCATCHGPLGNGRGKIIERGHVIPTSFIGVYQGDRYHYEADLKDELYRFSRGFQKWGEPGAENRLLVPMNPFNMKEGEKEAVPVGYYFEVLKHGYGAMPSYNVRLKPQDRWNVIAYIRVLQYSQAADYATAKSVMTDEEKRLAGKQLAKKQAGE